MKRFAILQSGFVTDVTTGLVKPEFIRDPFIDLAIDKDHLKSKSLFFYISDVNNLYEAWRLDNSLIRSFDFREKIIKTAKFAFNDISVYAWFLNQAKTSTVGPLHEQFVIETIEFVAGRNRSIQTIQWIRLIEASVESRSVKINVDKYFDKQKYKNELDFSSNLLSDFLVVWTSRVNGYEDLLLTLYVIFGDRPYVTDVADKNVN